MNAESVTIVIRHFDPSTDEGFIYSSWRNSSFYLAASKAPDEDGFFRNQTKRIKEILKFAEVRIACHADSPLVIVGYSVCTGRHLNWVYVKVDYRGKGIARMLVPENTSTFTDAVTKIGKVIAFQKNLTLKENTHGRTHRPADSDCADSHAEKPKA